jgi:TetR/AcrR family transcriptional regulator, tetracycline repressor protein
VAHPHRGPGTRAGLTARQILTVARERVEHGGVESLTMRGLADQLGVAPNSIYSHFADKAALVDAVLDDLLAEIPGPGAVDSWQDGIVELMTASREMLLRHAPLLPYLFSGPMRGPQVSRLTEASLALLEQGGIRGPDVVAALRAILTYTFGSVALDAPRRLDDPVRREAAGVAAFAASSERRVAALAEPLARRPAATDFPASLRWLLDGLERALGERSSSVETASSQGRRRAGDREASSPASRRSSCA